MQKNCLQLVGKCNLSYVVLNPFKYMFKLRNQIKNERILLYK